MPTLEELFKTKTITEGPNTGKTAQEAYAIQDSKKLPVGTSNVILQKINKNTTGGLVGKVVNLFDFIEKINDRRKKYGVKDGESFIEEEQAGLKQFAITAKPALYGGDLFRISNGRTRTLAYIKKHAQMSIGGGVDDKIANAIGNFAGDYVNNIFAGRKGKDAVPPTPDLVSLGTDIAVDVLDRTLGNLLPSPMVPSKVADEIQKKGNKFDPDFIHEYNRKRAIIKLSNRKKLPGFVDNLLKQNTNLLSQSNDVISSRVGSIVSGAVKAGASMLVKKGIDAIIKNKKKNNIAKAGKLSTKALGQENTPWSSANLYSKQRDYDILLPLSEQTTLKGIFLQTVAERLKLQGVKLPSSSPGFKPGADDTIPDNANPNSDEQLLEFINKTPAKTYSTIMDEEKLSLFTKRLMATKIDGMNISNDIPYDGISVSDAETKLPFDSYDFIPLKFYSVAKDKTVQFRGTITNFVETFTPEWETNKFLGNPFSYYTYNGFERSCTFSFKVFSLNVAEHIQAWKRLDFLGKLTMPQSYRGAVGAVAPPIIRFTMGDIYNGRPAIIENLSFSANEDSPWEIGLNQKLIDGAENMGRVKGTSETVQFLDPDITGTNHKAPMIIDVEVGLKFIESRSTVDDDTSIYGFTLPSLNYQDKNQPITVKTENYLNK